MDRRAFLASGAALGSAALAGCGILSTEPSSTGIPPVLEDRPDGVYIPTHVEGMEMIGTAEAGDYAFALMYSYAHRFWNVNGTSTQFTEIDDGDAVHLMASVWDPETGTVLPETGLSIEVTRDGDVVSQEVIYPMLSQPMGFHYGANFGLDDGAEGTYTVDLSVGGMSTRRTGGFQGTFGDPATATIDFEYSESEKNDISYEERDDAGERGALEPMSMEMVPDSTAPAEGELPGTVLGSGRSNDAVLLTTLLDSPPAGVDGDGQYLAVSARSRYNEMIVPAMGLSGTLTRGGESVFDGELRRTLDSDLGYHYGATVEDVQSGDELTLSVTTPAQTARHEGYETAFGGSGRETPDVAIDVEL
jgi:hypothetical protein